MFKGQVLTVETLAELAPDKYPTVFYAPSFKDVMMALGLVGVGYMVTTLVARVGGGHGGHNGVRDVIRHCGADFLRLRIGVGHPGEKDRVTGYVLKRASSDVEALVEKNVEDAVAVLPVLLEDGLNAAMKKLHTKQVKED